MGLFGPLGHPRYAEYAGDIHSSASHLLGLIEDVLMLSRYDATDGVTLNEPVELGPCDGRIFMITPKPLLGIKLDAPETATVGNEVKVTAGITTTQDTPTKAVVPVRVTIRDANGKSAEGSGFYAAENGIVELSLNLAANEDPGAWEIRVKELASGMEAVKWMRVGK